MTASLRILITTLELATRRGVQNVTRDLALGLCQAGHEVCVYTRKGGVVADELKAQGVRVETKIARLVGATFDVIHSHHPAACSPVFAEFPETPAVFVCHGDASWFDAAVRLPNIVTYAAVSESMAERVAADTGIPRQDIALLLNAVDTKRFLPGPAPQNPPRRALAFAKNSEHVAVLQTVCAQRGIAVDFIGAAVETQLDDPARVLPGYDLVFASALSAIEAMACLRPTIVCDGRGMAGMVDMARYEAWRPKNFGVAALNGPLSVQRVAQELDRYDPAEAARVGERLRAEAGLDAWIEQCVALYREAMDAPRAAPEESARMWAQHLERWTPRLADEWAFTEERQALINEVRRLRAGLDELPLGDRITFGDDRASARFIDTVGFERRDGTMWTSSSSATMRFRLGVLNADLDVEIEFATYLPAADVGLQITLLANGVEIERWTEAGYAGWTERVRTFRLPRDMCRSTATWLAFQFAQTAGAVPGTAPGLCMRSTTFRLG
ncbi:MAG: glycosyltransferase family 4 protein [Hyphomonadaceae bacterium]|nr:glycosyltransferase family 4 protein [Caulobacteraceae bacterium]MBP6688801.1 glycosyltransferase family 4 protein [Hyphomonadaceae bacterium]